MGIPGEWLLLTLAFEVFIADTYRPFVSVEVDPKTM